MTPVNFMCSQTGGAEKQRRVCGLSEDNQASFHKNEAGFIVSLRGQVGQADVPAGAFRRAVALIQIAHICNMRNFLLIKEGSQVTVQDEGFTLGFVFELLNPILCVISKSAMCNYGNH